VYCIETERGHPMQEVWQMESDLAIGVDFGGTKLLAAVVDVSTGDVLGTAKKKTNPDDDAKALMHRIYDGIDDAVENANSSASATARKNGMTPNRPATRRSGISTMMTCTASAITTASENASSR